MMKIAIAGGSGFVGMALIQELRKENHEIYILTRNPEDKKTVTGVKYVKWLVQSASPEIELAGIEAFINLSGESLNSGRWTDKRKRQIVESRVETTREMIRILSMLTEKPAVVINASAIGYYGTSEKEVFTEKSGTFEEDFLSRTVQLWEKEASKAKAYCHRLVFARFGVILGKSAGALPMMVTPYHFFAGGTIGTGRQWLSWIHITDVARALLFCVKHDEIKGPVNFSAPSPRQMKNFGETIGTVLNRPHWFPVPSFLLKIMLGEMSALVLEGQKVIPDVLQRHEFTFTFPNLEVALHDLLK